MKHDFSMSASPFTEDLRGVFLMRGQKPKLDNWGSLWLNIINGRIVLTESDYGGGAMRLHAVFGVWQVDSWRPAVEQGRGNSNSTRRVSWRLFSTKRSPVW